MFVKWVRGWRVRTKGGGSSRTKNSEELRVTEKMVSRRKACLRRRKRKEHIRPR